MFVLSTLAFVLTVRVFVLSTLAFVLTVRVFVPLLLAFVLTVRVSVSCFRALGVNLVSVCLLLRLTMVGYAGTSTAAQLNKLHFEILQYA